MSSAAGLVQREPTKASMTREEVMMARNLSKQIHPAGRPVSRSTYVNYGCRCDGCKHANAEYTRAGRGQPSKPPMSKHVKAVRASERRRRENLAMSRALRHLAQVHPQEYLTFLRISRFEIDLEYGPLPGDPS